MTIIVRRGQNGRTVDSAQIGWKDVVRVAGPTEILLRFDKLASEETPFINCHILETRGMRGMMGSLRSHNRTSPARHRRRQELTSSCGVHQVPVSPC